MNTRVFLAGLATLLFSSVTFAGRYDCHMLLNFKTTTNIYFAFRGDMLHFDELKVAQLFYKNGKLDKEIQMYLSADQEEYEVLDDGRNYIIKLKRFHEVVPGGKDATITFSARIKRHNPEDAVLEIGGKKFKGSISIDRRSEHWLYNMAREI